MAEHYGLRHTLMLTGLGLAAVSLLPLLVRDVRGLVLPASVAESAA
ncbi:hypothetical protein ACWGR4_29130 [Embleya sp. NPDC055664]